MLCLSHAVTIDHADINFTFSDLAFENVMLRVILNWISPMKIQNDAVVLQKDYTFICLWIINADKCKIMNYPEEHYNISILTQCFKNFYFLLYT